MKWFSHLQHGLGARLQDNIRRRVQARARVENVRSEEVIVAALQLQSMRVSTTRRLADRDEFLELRIVADPIRCGQIPQDRQQDRHRYEPLLSVDDLEVTGEQRWTLPPIRVGAGVRKENSSEEIIRLDRLAIAAESEQNVVEELSRLLDGPCIAALIRRNREPKRVGE